MERELYLLMDIEFMIGYGYVGGYGDLDRKRKVNEIKILIIFKGNLW